jgi:hypothetical protein
MKSQNPLHLRLNPSYDNFSEWIAAGFDLTGVDLARTRMLASKERSNSSNMTSRTSQILKEIRRHNTNLPNEDEQLANLYRLPKRPYGLEITNLLGYFTTLSA